jgi:predicted hotdog family 3-hydroxylacyl-ACP dehydratase
MKEAVIPHRPPLRFVTGVQREADGSILAEAVVRAGSPGADGQTVRPAYLIEIAAQAAAAHAAHASGNGSAVGGMLVGIKNWKQEIQVAVDEPITVNVREAVAFGNLRQFDAQVSVRGAAVAAGSLQVAQR